MALLCAAYGWSPEQVARLTPAQVAYFLRCLPDVQLRSAWPVAALEAGVRNMMGGKPDPNDSEGKTIPPERQFSPVELLPWFARPAWIDEAHSGIPQDAARDFMRNRGRVPSWALQVAPIRAIKTASGESSS